MFQLFPTLIVNIAAISVGLGYGFNSVVVSQLKHANAINATSSFDHLMDNGATSWIGEVFFHLVVRKPETEIGVLLRLLDRWVMPILT